MKKRMAINILGMAATVVGMAATLITNWVDDKKMDEKIEKKVTEALAQRENEKES